MSQENMEIVRKPLEVRAESSRTLEQRVAMRFPRLAAASARVIGRLPPRSRLRQSVLWRVTRLSLEAYNRRDLDAAVIGYAPEFEYRPAHSVVETGFLDRCYRGLEGYRKAVATTTEVWGAEIRIEPVELIDLGEHLVVLADMPMRAQASGVPLTSQAGFVLTLQDGRAIRHQEYLDPRRSPRSRGAVAVGGVG